MRITAKADYAIRAMVELAAGTPQAAVKAERIAGHQDIPLRFLLNILGELKLGRLVDSRRGPEGGYWLARDPASITLADVIRAVEGPLAEVHGIPPERLTYPAPATALRDVWIATRVVLRHVLEGVTVADIVAGALPSHIEAELADPGAWQRR
ncbi:MAG: RrF2 family transcriptional regulator [Acidimicrobiales bacterium]